MINTAGMTRSDPWFSNRDESPEGGETSEAVRGRVEMVASQTPDGNVDRTR